MVFRSHDLEWMRETGALVLSEESIASMQLPAPRCSQSHHPPALVPLEGGKLSPLLEY
jgi:hypothetical protein